MNYKNQYLKYKLKYLLLKQTHNLSGGAETQPSTLEYELEALEEAEAPEDALEEAEAPEDALEAAEASDAAEGAKNEEINKKNLKEELKTPEKYTPDALKEQKIPQQEQEQEQKQIHIVGSIEESFQKFYYDENKTSINEGKDKIFYSFDGYEVLEDLLKKKFNVNENDNLCIGISKKNINISVYQDLYNQPENIKKGLQIPYMVDSKFILEKRMTSDLYDFIIHDRHKYKEKQIISMIFEGLLNLFKAGYIHLDLKPENILIEYEEDYDKEDNDKVNIKSVKITDLDSIPDKNIEVNMENLGGITLRYFDPLCITKDQILLWKDNEKYRNDDNTDLYAVNDLYSLGCIIYILYVGKIPHLALLGKKYLEDPGKYLEDPRKKEQLYEEYLKETYQNFEEILKKDHKSIDDDNKEFMTEIIGLLLNIEPNERLILIENSIYKEYLLSPDYPDIWCDSTDDSANEGCDVQSNNPLKHKYVEDEKSKCLKKLKICPP